MMRFVSLCLAGVSLLAAGTAMAGEEVLYSPAPDWVEEVDANVIDTSSSTPLALYDMQQRIEDGTLSIYVDRAFKLDAPQALTQAGTSTASWLPDKGDLTIHRVEILRGDKRIDLLEGGAKYTVLRRETQLEKRTLDGALTATLAVPGLELGDVLRIAFTQSIKDPTLKGEVQMTNVLFAAPTEAGFARDIVSWPEDEGVRWQTGPVDVAVEETSKSGEHRLIIALPLPEPEDMPSDSPVRYRRPALIQAGTFSSWEEVSSIFAPLYDPAGRIAQGSALAGEVATIRAASADPLERAALATRLVQDKISYLMNGMASGNYEPQAPDETWQLRYGDCKAKSLLLLSLLHELGISSEAVLVHSSASDAIPDLLPMPSAFDHVLVKANIGGKDYWLDGTSAGTRMSNIADTPPFRHVLPIRAEGTGVMALAPRVPATPQALVKLTFDERGGVDLPVLVTARAMLSGPVGVGLGAVIKQVGEDQKEKLIDQFASSTLEGLVVTEGSLSFDEDQGIAHVDVSGIRTTAWSRQGSRKRQDFADLPSQDVDFSPDRARPAWREIPVDTGAPTLQMTELTVLLPEDEDGYLLRGRPELDMQYGTTHFVRSAQLEGQTLTVTERVEGLGGEVPSEAIAAEKGKAARISNSAVFLLAPGDAVRQWQLAMPAYEGRLKPYEEAYAKVIAREPDKAFGYTNRALFRWRTANLEGALADYDKALELDPAAKTYRSRGSVLFAMDRFEDALPSYRKAFEIDPSSTSALGLAGALGRNGETEEALALLDEYDDYGTQHPQFVELRAEVLAYDGRAEEGLAAIDELIEERPGQGYLYNNSCWYRARFKVGTEGMIETCDKAVEQSSMAAAALDSRALAWLQLGEPAKALADADAAIDLAPEQTSSRYFRAVAQQRLGDDSGKDFIAYMDRFWPGQARDFAFYGLK
ncbi:DUF3857 domain-containing protein [Novosphingobium sp. BW1]|nr:DUF3857 domain-containing protein [Novosphingobium sp. BW1]